VNMADEPGSLYKILKILAEKEVNVDYMYAFSNDDVALGVIRTENIPEVTKLLEGEGNNAAIATRHLPIIGDC